MDKHRGGSFNKDRRVRRGFAAIATVVVLLTLNLLIRGSFSTAAVIMI